MYRCRLLFLCGFFCDLTYQLILDSVTMTASRRVNDLGGIKDIFYLYKIISECNRVLKCDFTRNDF